MALEKACDMVSTIAMWQMLQMHGIKGRLLKAARSFYADSEAQVRVCTREGKLFPSRSRP